MKNSNNTNNTNGNDSDKAKDNSSTVKQEEANPLQQYAFVPPEKGFPNAMANIYADRVKVTRRYVIPSLATIVAGVGIWAGVNFYEQKQMKLAEARTEQELVDAYNNKTILEGKVNTLASTSTVYVRPAEISVIVNDTWFTLDRTKNFFNEYCPEGNPREKVTPENYKSVQAEFDGISKIILRAEESALKGESLIETDVRLVGVKKDMDMILSEIKNTVDAPKKLVDRANAEYNSGIASVKSLNLQSADEHKNTLSAIRGQITEFASLPSQLEQAYTSIKSVAKDKTAIVQADELYTDGQVQIKEANVPVLKENINSLKDMDAILRQEYTLTIVNRSDESTGFFREKKGEDGRYRISAYYVVVEALGSDGRPIRQKIKSIEDSETREVMVWGEKVPEDVFNRVREDKSDDGLLQNNIFSIKEKGYLNDRVILKGTDGRPLNREGQVLRW